MAATRSDFTSISDDLSQVTAELLKWLLPPLSHSSVSRLDPPHMADAHTHIPVWQWTANLFILVRAILRGLMLAVVIICSLSFSHFIIAHTHSLVVVLTGSSNTNSSNSPCVVSLPAWRSLHPSCNFNRCKFIINILRCNKPADVKQK